MSKNKLLKFDSAINYTLYLGPADHEGDWMEIHTQSKGDLFSARYEVTEGRWKKQDG